MNSLSSELQQEINGLIENLSSQVTNITTCQHYYGTQSMSEDLLELVQENEVKSLDCTILPLLIKRVWPTGAPPRLSMRLRHTVADINAEKIQYILVLEVTDDD